MLCDEPEVVLQRHATHWQRDSCNVLKLMCHDNAVATVSSSMKVCDSVVCLKGGCQSSHASLSLLAKLTRNFSEGNHIFCVSQSCQSDEP